MQWRRGTNGAVVERLHRCELPANTSLNTVEGCSNKRRSALQPIEVVNASGRGYMCAVACLAPRKDSPVQVTQMTHQAKVFDEHH